MCTMKTEVVEKNAPRPLVLTLIRTLYSETAVSLTSRERKCVQGAKDLKGDQIICYLWFLKALVLKSCGQLIEAKYSLLRLGICDSGLCSPVLQSATSQSKLSASYFFLHFRFYKSYDEYIMQCIGYPSCHMTGGSIRIEALKT